MLDRLSHIAALRWLALLLSFCYPLTAFAESAFLDRVEAKRYFPGSVMPEAERNRLAQRILGDSWRHDAEIDDYLSSAKRLLTKDDDYLVLIADTEAVNAFAHYGGIIVLYKGLWKFSRNEDEFLSVLAHEMGHIKYDHFQKQKENTEQIATLSLPLLIAGLLSDDPETRNSLIIGSSGIISSNIYAYSRELEHEADIFGLQAILDNNRNGHAMASIFSRLGGAKNEYISTHPAAARRGGYLANRLHNETPPPPPTNDLGFYLLQEKLSLDNKVVAKKFEKARRTTIAQAASPKRVLVAHYGLLLLATATRNKALAEEMVAILKDQPHPYIARAIVDNLRIRGDLKQALKVLLAARQQYPKQPALALMHLSLLDKMKQYKQLVKVYKKLPKDLKNRPDFLKQAGQAAAYLKQRTLSNYWLAYGQALSGNFEQALKQITLAEKFKDGDTQTVVKLSKLKRNVRKELKQLRARKIQG